MTPRRPDGPQTRTSLRATQNPLPPLEEAIRAGRAEVARGNHYPPDGLGRLRDELAHRLELPARQIRLGAGSEPLLRRLVDAVGGRTHLITPGYPLFPFLLSGYTETRRSAQDDFAVDLDTLELPEGTTLVVLEQPSYVSGTVADMRPVRRLLETYPGTYFLVDEAFIDLGGTSLAGLVPSYSNLIVTRTFSKAHSLAGLRIGYAILPDGLWVDDALHPLSSPAVAAALATLEQEAQVRDRVQVLRAWTSRLGKDLRGLGVRTFASSTYFLLAEFTPLDAARIVEALGEAQVPIETVPYPELGPGFLRITCGLPTDNERFAETVQRLL